MVEKRRARDRREVRIYRADQALAKAIRKLIEATADQLENPTAFEYAKGDQRHFLDRLERLPDDARDLALRLYYHGSLSRFVTRRALGQPLDHLFKPALPADGAAPRRLSFALDDGPAPPWLVLEETGQVITCLAPGMEGGAEGRSFAELSGWIFDFERWSEQNRSAKQRARVERVDRDVLELRRCGWWTPREVVRSLADLGDAGSLLITELLRQDLIKTVRRMETAIIEGGRGDDRALRRWLCATGTVAGFCAAFVDGRMPAPHDNLIHALLGPVGLDLALVVGAALARWRPEDGGRFVNPRPEEEPPGHHAWTAIPASAVYWGTLRRRAPRSERERIRQRVDPELEDIRTNIADLLPRVHPADVCTRMMLTFDRDLAALALDHEPDWGEDRVEFAQCLPPLRCEDVCLPGGDPSPRGPRHLAQRLLGDVPDDLSGVFGTRAEVRDWRERLGDPDAPRTGTFRYPYFDRDAPRRPAPPPAGRNEPCPCGSGKKYKKCCLPRTATNDSAPGNPTR